MQGEGMDPPPAPSVHFDWKWALRNSDSVIVCIDVSPSPSVGLSSRGPSSTSIILGISGASDPGFSFFFFNTRNIRRANPGRSPRGKADFMKTLICRSNGSINYTVRDDPVSS